MAKSLSPFVVRRVAFLSGLILISVLTFTVWRLLRISLRPDAIYTGLLLFALILALTFFNARKKLPFLPLVKAATWLQVHIYAGWFCLFIFLLHTGLRSPMGALEIMLALLFWATILSGIFGIYISRSLPPRMTASGEALL